MSRHTNHPFFRLDDNRNMVMLAALLITDFMRQADRWVLHPSEVVQKAAAFELLLSDDGKYVLQQGPGDSRIIPLENGEPGRRVSIRAYKDSSTHKVVFYSTLQSVPSIIAAHPDPSIKVDFAWTLSSNRSAVFSAHSDEASADGQETLYMVVLDFAERGSTPLRSGVTRQSSKWGLNPLAVRSTEGAVSWWVQRPGKGDADTLCKWMLNLKTGNLGQVTVCPMPSLRFTLYCPETGLAADFNSLLHYVSTWRRGSQLPTAVHTPAGAMGFCVTQKGVLLPIGSPSGEVTGTVHLAGGKWMPRGPIAVLGLDSTGRRCLVKNIKSGQISIRQE